MESKLLNKILGWWGAKAAPSPIETNDLGPVIARLNEVIEENKKLLSQSHNLIGQLKKTV